MKLKQILLGLFGLGLLASCSNEDIVPGGGSNAELKPDGYIGVNLVLPSMSSTRAGEDEKVPKGSDDPQGDNPTNGDSYNGSFNDQFADGEPSEYAVNNGLLLIFKGDKEEPGKPVNEDATVFYGAYDLGVSGSNPGNGNQNVTTTYKRSVKVSGLNLKDNQDIYGLVFLNYNTAGIKLLENRGIQINGMTFEMPEEETPATGGESESEDQTGPGTRVDESIIKPGVTFAQVFEQVSTEKFYSGDEGKTAKGIFMTNSPLANTFGGSKNPSEGYKKTVDGTEKVVPFEINTLVRLTDGIQPTQADAEEHPAGTIYVERAVAKVTCSNFCGFDTGDLKNNITKSLTLGEYNLVITDIQWSIGNEQEDSYIVRNAKTDNIDWSLASEFTAEGISSVDPSRKFRMVSHTNGIDLGDKGYYYRPYWCIDPNYNKYLYEGKGDSIVNKAGVKIPIYAQTRDFISWNKDGVFYPHENTFDVDKMIYKNTTRICFNVTFNIYKGEIKEENLVNSENFYTRNDDRNTLYFDNEVGNPLVQNVMADLSEDEFLMNIYLNSLDHSGETAPGKDYYKPKDVFDIVFNDADKKGLLSVKSIKFKNSALNTEANENYFKELVATFNAEYKFYEYTNGNVFYSSTPIKHFGDGLTPWKTTGAATSVEESYTDRADYDNNWLGRYGLVRNNWYDIQVSKITKLGDPRDPAVWDDQWPGTPDDNNPQYLAVQIAILSWAKRIQNVEF